MLITSMVDASELYSLVEMTKNNMTIPRFNLMLMQQMLQYTNSYNDNRLYSSLKANLDLTERLTRTYRKPKFGITHCVINGVEQKVIKKTLRKGAFCHLQHFSKPYYKKELPKLLIVAPMSGHHATLLRGTVQDTLPYFDVYVTDWIDASQVPITSGSFDLDSFIDYTINYIKFLGENVHVMAVCQPTVPVLAAAAIMSEDNDHCTPKSIILIGGPIDARKNPTKPGDFANDKSLTWFDQTLITNVPVNYPGYRRRVYPGFLQLFGFVAMNLKNHVDSHFELFKNLILGDDVSVIKHKKFYDEYFAVMDLPAEFYLQTIKEVFHDFSMAKGKFMSRGRKVNLSAITKCALMGIEGEKDDIAAVGQTKAALDLCKNIPSTMKNYYLQEGVGHYGSFTGSKFRQLIVPRIKEFVYENN